MRTGDGEFFSGVNCAKGDDVVRHGVQVKIVMGAVDVTCQEGDVSSLMVPPTYFGRQSWLIRWRVERSALNPLSEAPKHWPTSPARP